MRLRGITYQKSTVEFQVSDVPIFINSQSVILARKKNSPILRAQSIARGDDTGTLFETDFVLDKKTSKVIGMVVYTDGFYIWNHQDDALIPIRSVEGLEFVPNTQMHRVAEMATCRSRIRFGCGDRRFNLDKLIYYKGEELFITIKASGRPIRLDSICYGTGVNVDKLELMYGQVIPNGLIVLKDFHPMLQLPDGSIRELEESDYDELGTTRNTKGG